MSYDDVSLVKFGLAQFFPLLKMFVNIFLLFGLGSEAKNLYPSWVNTHLERKCWFGIAWKCGQIMY